MSDECYTTVNKVMAEENKFKNVYTKEEIENSNTFYRGLLTFAPKPNTSYEALQYINIVANCISTEFPRYNRKYNFYTLSQIHVETIDKSLGSIVHFRHTLQHPTSIRKWYALCDVIVADLTDSYRMNDKVPDYLKEAMDNILTLNWKHIFNFCGDLYSDSDKSIYGNNLQVIVKSAPRRGRKPHFSPELIAYVRKFAPSCYIELPDDEFCEALRDVLIEFKNKGIGGDYYI